MGNSCCIIIIVYNLSVMVPMRTMTPFFVVLIECECVCVYVYTFVCACCVLCVHTCRFTLNRDTHYCKSKSKASVKSPCDCKFWCNELIRNIIQ